MRHSLKNSIIGLIIVSFVMTPEAFAKPAGSKKLQRTLGRVKKVVKESKNGVKLSSFLEATKPILRRKVYKQMARDASPYWDSKMSKVVYGKDFVIIRYRNEIIHAKYVDRGPMAFIVNNKPFLWKDLMTYEKTKARLAEIITGKNASKRKKVSFFDSFMNQLSMIAYADYGKDKKTTCKQKNRDLAPSQQHCGPCLDGFTAMHPLAQPPRPYTDEELNDFQNNSVECMKAQIVEPPNEPVVDEEEFDWLPLALFAGAALLIFLLSRRDNDSDDTPAVTPTPPVVVPPTEPPVEPPPVAGWTPEGSCPTPGARGLTPADLPPECRSTTCTGSSCNSTGNSLDSPTSVPGF